MGVMIQKENSISFEKYAFFDVDGTILRIRSMMAFQSYYYRYRTTFSLLGILCMWQKQLWWTYNIVTKRDRHIVNRKYYESFQGKSAAEVMSMAKSWYKLEKQTRPDFFITETIKILRKHQEQGVKVVLVSGSFLEILEPLAEDLNIKHCLATVLEVEDGAYTGNILSQQMIGQGKAIAVKNFLSSTGALPELCYAYGDHHTDIPMLETVGNPVAIRGDEKLMNYASTKGWETIACGSRPLPNQVQHNGGKNDF